MKTQKIPKRNLPYFIMETTSTLPCTCEQCVKSPVDLHNADVVFFKVSMSQIGIEKKLDEFLILSDEHVGDFAQPNVFDGLAHSYIELGGWLDSQELALRWMGLGQLLGVGKVYTVAHMFPQQTFSEERIKYLAQTGGLAFMVEPPYIKVG
jgi:hypothetical protein